MNLRKAVRTTFLFSSAALLLSACVGGFGPNDLPPVPNPADEIYHPKPEEHPTCVEQDSYNEEGEASWYGRTKKMHKTASGQILDSNASTAAHRYLPLGSQIKVTNLSNGRSTVVTINDRGPYKKGRIIDMSRRSANDLGFIAAGVTRVRLETTQPRKSEC